MSRRSLELQACGSHEPLPSLLSRAFVSVIIVSVLFALGLPLVLV